MVLNIYSKAGDGRNRELFELPTKSVAKQRHEELFNLLSASLLYGFFSLVVFQQLKNIYITKGILVYTNDEHFTWTGSTKNCGKLNLFFSSLEDSIKTFSFMQVENL